MKPVLILGLGNSLMGDDGVGGEVAGLLAADPRLPAEAESFAAGTDLLRWADEMLGRRRVILIDAILGDASPGSVELFENNFAQLEIRQWTAHHLSPPHAITLLRSAMPALRDARFTLFAISIEGIRAAPGLSPEIAARLPEMVNRVLAGASETF
jgi:hydrogenase maturation protease